MPGSKIPMLILLEMVNKNTTKPHGRIEKNNEPR
jgi:hypothetical protein